MSNPCINGPSYQAVLACDRMPAPPDFYEHHPYEGGPDQVDATRYYSREFQALEHERMWTRVWQFVCREEDLPEPGDMLEYKIGDKSFIVVRGDDNKLRCFPNACRHRGMKLCEGSASLQRIRCRYHGFTWELDGRLAEIPCGWDFPHIAREQFALPPLSLQSWQGFVFINPDPDAIPLDQYLEVIPSHFQGFSDYSDRHVAGYYTKILPANWKATLEAFLEAFHLPETHPQMCGFTSEIATQYDVFSGGRHVSRFIGANGVASPTANVPPGEQQVIDSVVAVMTGGRVSAPVLEQGTTARSVMADMARQSSASSDPLGRCSDAEMIDGAQYMIFPNMVLFRGFGYPVVYRFRPNGLDPESCVFDMLIMRATGKEVARDPTVPVEMGDRSYQEAVAELPSWLAEVYDQDAGNLAAQQRGFHDIPGGLVTFSRYQESRLRHFHMVLDSYLSRPGEGQ